MSPNQPGDQPNNQRAFLVDPSGPRHIDPEDLTLYAMQLLNADEAATIAGHVDHCEECRAELARIYSDLAAAALNVDLEMPPAAARQRLIQQVAREKKIVTAPPAQTQPQAPRPIAAFGRAGSVFAEDPAQPRRSAGRSILAWSGWAVAACLAVAAGLVYGDRSALRDALNSQDAQLQRLTVTAASSHQLLDALTDPRAVRVTLTTKPLPKTGPVGGVTYNPEKGALIFLASDLDPLQALKTYELWVIPADGSAPIPAGTFHPDDQGNASVIMPDLPKGIAAKAFGVTIEVEGGAQTPTLPIIMAGS